MAWFPIIKKQDFAKHGEILKYLKEKYGFTHGFQTWWHIKQKHQMRRAKNTDDLISGQYQGKEHFKPIYDKLISSILQSGNGIEIAPKKAYVS